MLVEAVSVAILHEGRFLLVRRARAPSMGLYAFPGGRVEAGEDAFAAAARELFEETGVTAADLAPFRQYRLGGGGDGADIYDLTVFTGRHLCGEPVAGDDASEAGWYLLAEMAGLPITNSTLVTARAIAREAAQG